jgi:spermidine synthase
VLDSADFYRMCRQTLTPEGCMTVNLFGRRASFQHSLEQMTEAFGPEALWAFKPTREGNTVVLAQRTPSAPARAVLLERAAHIQQQWGLPAEKWVRGMKQVQP